jgi:plasmid stabilization system protein ParE
VKLRILPSALNDLQDGRDFYDEQELGLGDYFLDSLFSDIDSLALYAGIHTQHWGYHRVLSKRFPHAIYYKLKEDRVDVWRVFDCRQNPRKIARALRKSG